MKKTLPQLLFALILLQFLFPANGNAQYAHYTFFNDEGQAFQLSANGKQVYDGFATYVTIRVNQGKNYKFLASTPSRSGTVADQRVIVPANGISATYEVKEKKNGAWTFRLKDQNPSPASNLPSNQAPPAEEKKSSGITYKVTKSESYAGPDGAYSKEETHEGSLGDGGLTNTTTRSSATADENGFNANVEQKTNTIGNIGQTAGDVKSVVGIAKGRKKDKEATATVPVDGRDLVVTEIQLANESGAGPAPTSKTGVSSPAQPAATAAPAAKSLPAARTITEWSQIGQVQTETGFEIYLVATPKKKYKTLFEIKVDIGVLNPEWVQENIDKMIEETNETLQKKRYMGERIDAIIYVNGSSAEAVQFIESGNELLAETPVYKDKELYFRSVPKRTYEVVGEFDNSKARGSTANYPFQLNKTVVRINKDNPDLDYDAIMTDDLFQVKMIKFVD